MAFAWAAAGPAAAYPTAQRPLLACDFVTESTGWAVGAHQVVLRTVTGGALWLRQRSVKSAAVDLLDVSFVDRASGWVAGEDGLLLSTVDSGATWTVRQPLAGATWQAVATVDAQTAVAAGWTTQAGVTGVLLRTADSGATWAQAAALPGVRLNDVRFSGRLHGWAVGVRDQSSLYGTDAESLVVLRTEDGGVTWSEVVVSAAVLDPAAEAALYAVTTVGGADIWCAGRTGVAGHRRGLLLHSADGGATWLAATSSAFSSFRGVSFGARKLGWAVGTGAGAACVRTRDAGATWRKVRLPVGSRACAVDFVDARRGWIVGDTTRHKGLVARTRNAGATWVRVR